MRTRLVLAGALLLALGGCAVESDEEAPRRPVTLPWREVELPVPAGEPGRVAVRDAVSCGEAWYAVGGVYLDGAGDDTSRPAVWTSRDGEAWTSVPLAPRTYWGRRAILTSIACRDGELALLGSREGGAHGNPRVTTFHQQGAGFTDVEAAFELYGGPQAVSVGRIAGGARGWLIAGNRVRGAAVWTSPDARGFDLVDDDPQLSRDDTFGTTALDQVADGDGWTLVGSATTPGRVPRVPLAWVSGDGRTWQREEVPSTDGFNDLERVAVRGDTTYAVGLRGDRFGVWTRVDGYWRTGEAFGRIDPEARAAPSVADLAVAGDDLLATVSDGTRYGLWLAGDSREWRRVGTPSRPTTAGEHVMGVATDDDEVLLLADDGERGRVWLARR